MMRKVILRLCIHMRRLQQRLGRNTADVETGPTERPAALHTRHVQAQLGSLDRADVSTRTTADDDHVLGRGGGNGRKEREAVSERASERASVGVRGRSIIGGLRVASTRPFGTAPADAPGSNTIVYTRRHRTGYGNLDPAHVRN